MVNELFKIIDEKNKVIMDRDNIIRELRTKLLEAESERDSLKQQKYSLDTQDTSQCNDTIENQRSLSSKTIPIEETTGERDSLKQQEYSLDTQDTSQLMTQ
jgi:hypothetical protein